MMTIPVTAMVITLNEESNIHKCLQSVAFCEERLVVDSGSTDRTVEIARQSGARVIHNAWPGFGKQKQFGVLQARHQWVLCLDADEWLSDELAGNIQQLFTTSIEGKLYQFARRDFFLGRWLKHGGYPEYSPRLFHRDFAQWSDAMVHETVITRETALTCKGDLMHYTADSLGHAVEKRARYGSMQVKDMYSRGVRPSMGKLLISPLARFIKLYLLRQGFRDGVAGFVLAVISSFFCFYKYAMLYELEFNSKKDRSE